MSANTPFSISPFFTPLQIPGCQYWFDASDRATTVASGTNLTTWINKGTAGSAGNITVLTGTASVGTSSQNGLNVIVLPTGTELVFTGSFPTQARTRFFASKPTVNTTTNVVTFLYQNKTTLNGNDFCGTDGSSLVEVAQGQIVNLVSATIPNQQNQFSVYTFANATSSRNNNRLALTGSPLALTTNITANQYNINSATNYINATSGNTSAQELGEWISYNSELTLPQIQQVEAYLAWKWGVVQNLPDSNPFKQFYRALVQPTRQLTLSQSSPFFFRPINISNCQLWLDAADASTLSLSATNVTQWNDKSGSNNNATQVNAGNRPVYNSANNSIAFTRASSQYLDLPNNTLPTGNNSYAYFIVASWATAEDGLALIGGGAFGTNNGVFALRSFGVSRQIHQYWWNNDLTTGTGAYTTNQTLIVEATYTSGGARATLTNGTQLATDNPSARAQTGLNNTLGTANLSPGPAEYHNGTISELIVYNTTLTTQQRQQVEGYLAWKWGLQANLPANHPYKNFPSGLNINPALISPSFYTRSFQPTNIPNCQLWLDAADASTVSLSGTTVSQWRDKSGSNLSFLLSTGTPTYGNSAITVPYGALLQSINTISLTTNTYAFTVARLDSDFYFRMLLAFPNINDFDDYSIRYSSGILVGTQAQVGDLNDFSAQGTYYVNGNFNPNYNYSTYSNVHMISGQSQKSGTTSVTISGTYTFGNDRYFIGNVYEVLLYTSPPTTQQRQQIEGYLAWKWGLVGSLPGTHPYKVFPPPPI